MGDRETRVLAVVGAALIAALSVYEVRRRRANEAALAAEARTVAPLLEADRVLRREDQARAARREAEAAAEREALMNRPEVIARRAYAAEVSAQGGVRAAVIGMQFDELVIRDDRCAGALYLRRMLNEGSLSTRALLDRRFSVARCEGPLGACSELDPGSDEPRPCRAHSSDH